MTFSIRVPRGHELVGQSLAPGDLAWMIASTDDETGEPYENYDRLRSTRTLMSRPSARAPLRCNAGTGQPRGLEA